MTKRTLQGSKRKKIRVSGFRARMKTPCGRSILNSRRRKGRKKIMVS
uniref:Large ribosomal subunit protein bL34c n=2 Tax=Pyropia yezoensis TaxID=2788 RepID=RK34_PYRYE|nr:ribosomal protein L34 [Neopyropia yezoensis]Q1XDU7.1 RecName: Full=Large ribosomal subunit protein bL34c; AltName: Full=50S ribosomal protein L34, chloroplastic [Neopyropia yezoensis]AGH27514.1 ribosomal protein L34 [Neopyropia yezoensis]QFZ66850.1 ribosomal protein L34 [Neopyropia yezoensis]ULU28855.1 ribosomal protein L34 [Neopyropia yezoensis]WKD83345.1 ribosomal protein L34 [Neopyropia yezoensis]BAE92314.1 50S ribosomal protein L34 [Neopyropia yezoensis]